MARQRKRKGEPVTGWINLFKPVDMTSTQAVAIIKRLYNAEKVGHGGTLDPLADGILPIALGQATKTVQWAMDAHKEYVFTIRWGISTASQDAEADITATSDVRPERAAIEEALKSFVGTISQVPPKYSAIKVAGNAPMTSPGKGRHSNSKRARWTFTPPASSACRTQTIQ